MYRATYARRGAVHKVDSVVDGVLPARVALPDGSECALVSVEERDVPLAQYADRVRALEASPVELAADLEWDALGARLVGYCVGEIDVVGAQEALQALAFAL